MTTRDEILFQANLAEQTERYNECIGFLKQLGGVDTDEECQTLSEVIKKGISVYREALERLTVMLKAARKRQTLQSVELIKKFGGQLQADALAYLNKCEDVVEESNDPDRAISSFLKAYFYKCSGDIFRYKTLIKKYLPEKHQSTMSVDQEHAVTAYDDAMRYANSLDDDQILKESIMLNLACMKYELLGQKEEACDLLEDVIKALRKRSDTPCVMQTQAENNLKLWKGKRHYYSKGVLN